MPLVFLVLGLVLFVLAHSLRHIGDLRARIIAAVGANTYRGLFSLVSILGIALVAHGFDSYRAAGFILVWDAPRWAPHLVIPLMTAAMILLAATYLPGRIKAAASDAAFGENLGCDAFVRQWRSGIDRPVRDLSRMGGVAAHRAEGGNAVGRAAAALRPQ